MGFVQQTSWAQPVELGYYQNQREQSGFGYVNKSPRQQGKSNVLKLLVAILAMAIVLSIYFLQAQLRQILIHQSEVGCQ